MAKGSQAAIEAKGRKEVRQGLLEVFCTLALVAYVGFMVRWLWDEVRGCDTSWRR
jgi:hypothetical protein